MELVEKHVKGSKILMYFKDHPHQFLTVILVGNNFVNIAASALATSVIQSILIDKNVASGVATLTAIVTGIMTFIILVFGEITPKSLALKRNVQVALSLAPFVYFLSWLLYPLVLVLNFITGNLLRLIGGQKYEPGSLVTEDEILMWVNLGHEQGVIKPDEAKMIAGVFELGDQVVREVITPLSDMVSIAHTASIAHALEVFGSCGHSRMPVTKDGSHNIVGILYTKDVLRLSDGDRHQGVERFMREALFVPESKPLVDTLKIMKTTRMHLLIVLDEYGATIGLVTLEDLLEEIVGEIRDEHEIIPRDDYMPIGPDHFRVLAKMNFEYFCEKFSLKLPEGEAYDSIGGYLISHCGYIPKVGESFNVNHLELKVAEATKRRVIALEVKKVASHAPR